MAHLLAGLARRLLAGHGLALAGGQGRVGRRPGLLDHGALAGCRGELHVHDQHNVWGAKVSGGV